MFIPKKWFLDDYKLRRKKCKLPDNIEFKTKPQLAVQMFDNIVEEQIIPFKYVLADSLYGTSPEFIEALESLIGTTYPVKFPKGHNEKVSAVTTTSDVTNILNL